MSLVKPPSIPRPQPLEAPQAQAQAATAPRPPYSGSPPSPSPSSGCSAADDDAPTHPDDMPSMPPLAAGDGDGPAPALPAKSALRASRLLTTLPLKVVTPDDRPMVPHAAPHHVYLSSEEDVSSSADDLSDVEPPESDSEQSVRSTASTRARREDTARLVTVVFHGRPSIVELPRRCSTPGSTDSSGDLSTDSGPPALGMLRTSTMPALARPRSVSSALTSPGLGYPAPPRSSSMKPAVSDKKRPLFLTIDPFAPRAPSPDEPDSLRTPKTPTAMLRKTLSLVKKRSRPALNQSAAQSRESLSLHISPMTQVGEEAEAEAQTPRDVSPATRGPASYHDILRGARRNAEATPRVEATSPLSPNPGANAHKTSRFRSGLSIGRPRSIRA